MTRPDTQNIYDNAAFFASYKKLARSQHGLDGVPEWPCLRDMILSEPIEGKSLLDLGCGYGWMCRWARREGAAQITGMDVSTKMIAQAREIDGVDVFTNGGGEGKPKHASIAYEVRDLETVQLDRGAYDVVYSSLTFHYLENLSRLFEQVRACFGPAGGRFVFSVEHPTRTASLGFEAEWKKMEKDGVEHAIWPLHSYNVEGMRMTEWLGVDGVRKYHRNIETYVSLLIGCGFVLTGLKEWAPSTQDIASQSSWVPGSNNAHAHPDWVDVRDRPYFLFISAMVPSAGE